MQGYFKQSYFWELYEALFEKYPQFVSPKVKIGHSIKNMDINTFYIGTDMGKNTFSRV
jgi:hypothetical protein